MLVYHLLILWRKNVYLTFSKQCCFHGCQCRLNICFRSTPRLANILVGCGYLLKGQSISNDVEKNYHLRLPRKLQCVMTSERILLTQKENLSFITNKVISSSSCFKLLQLHRGKIIGFSLILHQQR